MKPIHLLALFLCLSGSCLAETLTWDACVAEARAHNVDLQQAAEKVRQERLGLRQSLSPFLPKLDLGASLGSGGGYDPLDGALGNTRGGGPGAYGLNLSASQNLFAGFSHVNNVDAARARLASAEASAREVSASVAFLLRQAFDQLLFAQEQTGMSEEIASRRKENVGLVSLRFEAGRENKGSLLATKAQASQARYDAARAGRELKSSALRLSQLLGRAPDTSLRVQGDLAVPSEPAEPDKKTLAAALPATLRARAQMEEAGALAAAANAPFLPSLSASASLNRSGDPGDPWPPQDGSWSAGLRLNWNLFNGFSDLVQSAEARSRLRVLRLALEDALRQAEIDLEQAFDAVLDAVESAQVQADFLEASSIRAEIGRAQYTQGLLNFDNWNQIESDLIGARKQGLSSRRGAVDALAAWERAIGKGFEP